MSTPAVSPLSTPLAWDLTANGYAETSLEQFSKYSAEALALAAITPADRVLDVACGPGSLSLQAAAQASEVAALDFSASMLDELRTRMTLRGITNIEIVQGDGTALPYPDARFDAAFSMFGLIFFPDRAAGFSELARVLRPGGRAVVSSWQPMSRVGLLVDVFEALALALPHVPFGDGKGPLSDPADFEREMRAAGFEVEICERTHHLVAPNIDELWSGMRRSLAPLVLLEHRMGSAAFAPISEGIERRLRERYPGAIDVAMPAWLALGKKPI